jgi:undecaprenyl diphosphate synthase
VSTPDVTLSEVEREVLAKMQARNPKSDPLSHLPDVPPSRIPRHVAIIMDGNGRWAQSRGFPRMFGHRNGAKAVREIAEHASVLGIEALTLYSFSLENWKRPEDEVQALMDLCITYLEGERDALVRAGTRFRVIGRREGLPKAVLDAIDNVTEATKDGTAGTLCLAINYGARAEIVDAARSLAADAARGALDPKQIDEKAFADRLGTAGMPDPDLLIRTAGEMRVSNYLLWQISYAELYMCDVLWPDFDALQLNEAVRAFAKRRRRFGGIETV